MIGWNQHGGVARIPRQRVQTVAARTVADVLVELVDGAPRGRARDLAGPEQADLLELARAFAKRRGLKLEIVADDGDPGLPQGALLPVADARLEGPTFAEWLAGDDPLAVPL